MSDMVVIFDGLCRYWRIVGGAGCRGWCWVRRMASGKGGHVVRTSQWGDVVDCPGDMLINNDLLYILCPSRRCFSERDRGAAFMLYCILLLQAGRSFKDDLYHKSALM